MLSIYQDPNTNGTIRLIGLFWAVLEGDGRTFTEIGWQRHQKAA